MYALVWLDQAMSVNKSSLSNPKGIYAIKVDEDNNILGRYDYTFQSVDLSKRSKESYDRTVANWRKFFSKFTRDFSDTDRVLFAYMKQSNTFASARRLLKARMGFKEYSYLTAKSWDVSLHVDEQGALPAENVANMHSCLKSMSKKEINDLFDASIKKPLRVSIENKLIKSDCARYGNDQLGLLERQVKSMCDTLGMGAYIENRNVNVFTLTGKWRFSLDIRPFVIFYHSSKPGDFETMETYAEGVYSPLEAVVYIKKLDTKLLNSLETEILKNNWGS